MRHPEIANSVITVYEYDNEGRSIKLTNLEFIVIQQLTESLSMSNN
jgi:hypothetical protein